MNQETSESGEDDSSSQMSNSSLLQSDIKPGKNIIFSKIRNQKPTEQVRTIANNDPLSQSLSPSNTSKPSEVDPKKQSAKVRTESLTIRPSDEARIIGGLKDAVKKHTTGSIFSVKVDVSKTGTLGIGVKDLSDNLLAVSMLKRSNGQKGSGESAGIGLGDLIFGINFIATREGSRSLLSVLKKEIDRGKKYLHLQCWRCHQLSSDPPPGTLFPKADDMFVQAYALFRNRVFSEWERWNFVEILLSYMKEELKHRAALAMLASRAPSNRSNSSDPSTSSEINDADSHVQKLIRARQLLVMDLEKNIMQAKGLRTALCVRMVHTLAQADAVLYVLRVEDVETGLQWVVHRRFRDFFSLHDELSDMTHFAKDVAFPKKRLAMRNNAKLVESRIVSLEHYVRKVLHSLTMYATMDPQASRALRHLQTFLGVDKYIDCIHPPLVDDQRMIELMAYRYLNDFNSPACQQCIRFVTSVDLDSFVTSDPRGYASMLENLKRALAEVEQFVLEHHQQQMAQELRERRPEFDSEETRVFIRKCVRRQVEAAIFLPLRRSVFRIVYSYIAKQAQKLQRSLAILQQAAPEYFTVDPCVLHTKSLPRAVKAFRDLIQAYLPADQGQLLMLAASAVVEVHTECKVLKKTSYHDIVSPNDSSTLNSPMSNSNNNNSNPNNENGVNTGTLEVNLAGMSLSPAAISTNATATSFLSSSPSVTNQLSSNQTLDNESNSSSPLRSQSDRDTLTQSRRLSTKSMAEILAGNEANMNLTAKEILDDPVKMMFASEETAPGVLHAPVVRDSSLGFDDEDYSPNQRPSGYEDDSNMEVNNDRGSLRMSFSGRYSSVDIRNDVTTSFEGSNSGNNNNSNSNSNKMGSNRRDSLLEEILQPVGSEQPLFDDNDTLIDSNLTDDLPSERLDSQEDRNQGDRILEEQGMFNNEETGATSSGLFETRMVAQESVIGADDFLPLFTYVLVQAGLPQLLLVKELMVALIDDEETYGECGYYLTTLEASTQHISDLADNFENTHRSNHLFDDGDDMYHDAHFDLNDLTRS